jgi:hypothetical protein
MRKQFEVIDVDVFYSPRLDVKKIVKINSSSLELINQCLRKAEYALVDHVRKDDEKPALVFGQAIHEALKIFYSTPIPQRSLAAVLAHFRASASSLKSLPPSDKRTITNGEAILKNYFQVYSNDPWVILKDQHGYICEREFEFDLLTRDSIQIKYFGTIDAVFQNQETQEVVVVDHKTTSTMGDSFYGKASPNHQFTGYLLAAEKALNLKPASLMMNGIQVAKTMHGLSRTFTRRTLSDYEEFKEMVFDKTKTFMSALETKRFPMAGYPTCVMWGGCGYKTVCETQKEHRKSMLQTIVT